MSTALSLKDIENKHDVYRGEDCMKKFFESLKEHAMKKEINFRKKYNEVVRKRTARIIWELKISCICKEKFEDRYAKHKKYRKVRNQCHYTSEYRGATHSTLNLKCSIPKRIPVCFHNGSNYDYDLIIK